MNWDPISWLEDAIADAGSLIPAPIRNWVTKEVKAAADLVENDVLDLWSTVDNIADDAINLFGEAEADATDAINGAIRELTGTIATVLGDAERYADDAVSAFERDILDPAINGAEDAISAVRSSLTSDFDSLVSLVGDGIDTAERYADDAVNGLERAGGFIDQVVDAAESVVEHYTDSAIDTLTRDVIDPLDNALGQGLSALSSIEGYVEGEVTDAVHLVEGAADWLALLGELTVDAVREIPSEIDTALNPLDWLDALAGDAPALASSLSGWAAAVFGL